MIYLDEKTDDRLKFENLLRRTKDLVEEHLKTADLSKIKGPEFETIVFNMSREAAVNTPFEGKLRQTDDREFPDIVDDEYFGVEVKVTKKDDWTSIGNSVLESSRVLKIEKIYVFFGKLGGTPEVKFRSYEECLKGIAVTHYPRYQIDMNLPEGRSIFDLMRTTYAELRVQKNPVADIRRYYSSQLKPGQELWWINDNIDDSTAPSPIIRSFSSIEAEERKKILAEIMILFPEVFSSERDKYKKIAPYLASRFGIVSPNLRDEFSAGGKARISGEDISTVMPHVVGEMIAAAPLIANIFMENEILNQGASRGKWLEELDRLKTEQPLSVIYNLALSGSLSVTYIKE